ncbi:MAG TPA: AMP-binding protein [Candidatus Acidoferrales bacterium]|nr:AMP-binding protein [Candidatus Acidoferrales bacterium]
MLYDAWQKVIQDRGDEVALRDLASGRGWTFAQIDRVAQTPLRDKSAMVFPQGHSPEFIFAVLQAWRWGAVVCPLEAHHQPLRVPPPPSPCCHLKTTPATTGVPRAVAFTEAQIMADARNIVATMGLRPDWPNLGVISMAYSYGFSNLVLPLLLHGIPLFLAPAPLPEILRGVAKAHWNLTVAGVPALWHAWHKAGVILNNVRLAISAGATLPLSLEHAVFEEHGVKIHNFYGSTECGGIAYDASETPRTDETSVGRPLRNVKVTVNRNGALVVRSRAVGKTYWPAPEATLARGAFQTCDLAEIRHGAICLRGHTSEHINVAGRKVSPAAIEEALQEHEAVDECLVFGVPSGNADRIDHIVACVSGGRCGTQEVLKQFLLQKLPSWQVPREWWFVDSIGINGHGKKIARAQWRKDFLKNRAKPGVEV